MSKLNLIVYRNLLEDELFVKILSFMDKFEDPAGASGLREDFYDLFAGLVEFAEQYGMHGHLVQCYLAYLLATKENVFARGCEMVGVKDSSLTDIAVLDFRELMKVLRFRWNTALSDIGVPMECVNSFLNFRNMDEDSKVFNHRIRDRICELADALGKQEDDQFLLAETVRFYQGFGVGDFGLNKAFRIVHPEGEDARLVPVSSTEHVKFSELIGYERQKKILRDNTESFLAGGPANNCLLFGDAGTGKSSSVKALLNEYYDRGLRMIEVYKHEFRDLAMVISQVKNRNYKFIIFMDDLSFEEFEIEYKYLKAVIEGGLEKKPDNVLIYATSNRRHLIREKWSDRQEQEEDLHRNDTVQEKLSLAARFGIQIYYGRPEPKEYKVIVKELAKEAGIDMPEEELLAAANRWELNHGGLSGRTARQFILDLLGKNYLEQ